MAAEGPQATNGTAWEPRPRRAQDDFIDMQYAKHDCKTAEEFVAEPWAHCRDPIHTYLSLRFEHRELFKSQLDEVNLKRVEHEEDRIAQTRANFSSYKEKDKMMKDLNAARREWKMEVKANIADYPARWKRSHADDPKLLERVQSWNVELDELNSSDLAPEVPVEPEYGFKACAIYFKKSNAGFKGHTHRHDQFLAGKFPNQKVPVHKILKNEENNPLSEVCPPGHLRYFHFPTNNMHWIETAIARYYNEPDGDHNDLNFKPSHDKSKAEKLLSREFWRGQVHGLGGGARGKGPIHARHMRSRCSIIPDDSKSATYTQHATESPSSSDPTDLALSANQGIEGKNFAIFLPYLHWETGSRRTKMAEIIQEVTLERLQGEENSPGRSNSASKQIQSQLKKKKVLELWQKITKRTKASSSGKTKLGSYLFALAQLANAMDYEADERLLRENLHHDPPLHIRRTLDQSYFLTLEDTVVRDKDQVVYRETRQGKSFHSRNTRVVMVDQLWLWILDDNTIISSFPRRWGRNKPDPSGVHKSLRERLAQIPEREIQSIYDLALIIIDQCSRVFFDRTKPLDQRPEVMDLFASAIGNVTDHTTVAYESFWRNMGYRALMTGPFENAESKHHKYLDINPEGTLLCESQDIAEELQIMLRIYSQQLHVVNDFRKILGHMNGESKNETDMARNLRKFMEGMQNQSSKSGKKKGTPNQEVVPESTIQHANDVLELLRNRQAEIQDLEDAALRTCQQLQGLLSLKQQQASILEAKAALQRADESVKQGRAIMAFTIVTIFFLPLGFLAAFFGMNNQEINASPWMSLREQLKYMFSISLTVIIIAISMAFSPWSRAMLIVLVRVPLAYIAEYTGLRAFWNDKIVGHAALERKGRQQLEYISTRKKRKEQKVKDELERLKKETEAKDKQWGPKQLVKTFHYGPGAVPNGAIHGQVHTNVV